MRILYVAHSLVALRQQLFAQELRKQAQAVGGDVKEMFPAMWGQHTRRGGWFVKEPGNLNEFTFPVEAYDDALNWKPTVVLIQQEAYSACAAMTAFWCAMHKIPYCTFSWENIPYKAGSAIRGYFQTASWNIFGNEDALHIGLDNGARRETSRILPQVGIDFNLFVPRPDGVQPQYDLGFFGRGADPMKGRDDLYAAIDGQGWSLLDGAKLGHSDYGRMANERFWRVSITCVPSKDIGGGHPKEQFLPAIAVESLATETPVVGTDVGSMMEWGKGCPAMWFAEQGNPTSLRNCIRDVLEGPGKYLGAKGREWAETKFANPLVAREYLCLFQKMGG